MASLDPRDFELTGEWRIPREGDFFLSRISGRVREHKFTWPIEPRSIVRPKTQQEEIDTMDAREKALLYLEETMENEGVHIELRVDAAKLILVYS